MTIRVYELAKLLSVTSKDVLIRAADLGLFVRSPSSPLSDDVAEKIRRAFGDAGSRLAVEPRASAAEGWRSSPVKLPTNPDVLENIDKMCAAFPVMAAHRRALQALGSQFVHAGYCRVPKFGECAVALTRFSGAIESAFGLTREVLFFYSPHPDTQIRTFEAAKAAIHDVPREVTPDIVFFYSADARLKTKLDDWSRGSFLGIPLQLLEPSDPIAFISLLRDYIFSRDLFYETTPVQGDRFFGRKTLLQGLTDDIKNQRVVGLYGLRKAGKTSVLTELLSRTDSPDRIVILQDLEYLPSPPVDPVPDLLDEIKSRVLSRLRESRLHTKSLVEAPVTIPGFKSGMQAVLRELSKRSVQLVLLLDEIEYLTPSDVIDVREGAMPSVAQFLGMLRSLVQENQNFTFVLSGLTSSITESGRLYGRPNPLFSWAKAYFLNPLDRREADNMAAAIGSRMGIRIESGALEALYEASGGHAFLYRHLASHVVDSLPLDVFERVMTRRVVLASQESWSKLIAGNVREMFDHVSRYYPDERFLLELLRDEPDSFDEFAREDPLAVGHLTSLGLVRREGHNYELSAILDLLS